MRGQLDRIIRARVRPIPSISSQQLRLRDLIPRHLLVDRDGHASRAANLRGASALEQSGLL